MKKFKESPAPAAWAKREATELKFQKIWGLKSYYTTPRDKIAWLKAINRNLYVLRDEDCTACKQHKERIFHIVKCGTIQRDLWKPLKEFMILNDIEVGDRLDLFFMFGYIRHNRYACPDAWGLILLAWRCIYAEITRSHKEGTACAPDKAFTRTLVMARTRLTAYGRKWRRWVISNRRTSRKSIIPEKPKEVYSSVCQ